MLKNRSTSILNKRGFSLLEMSIIIGIIAILMTMIFVFVSDILAKRRAIDTETRIDAIVAALDHYYDLNGHFPCPASRADLPSASTFGKEVNSGDCTYTVAPAGTLRVETVASNGIWMLTGVVPVKDILLSTDMIQDGYGNRFSYVVMQSLTETSTFSAGAGGLIVQDSGLNVIVNTGAFVVVSHGYDGLGAYRFSSGTLLGSCNATNLDKENCNWDRVFIDGTYNKGAIAANYFDDFVRWRSRLSY